MLKIVPIFRCRNIEGKVANKFTGYDEIKYDSKAISRSGKNLYLDPELKRIWIRNAESDLDTASPIRV